MVDEKEVERVKKAVVKTFKKDIKEISEKHKRPVEEVEEILTKFILELIGEMKK